jgi:hypothetical protein
VTTGRRKTAPRPNRLDFSRLPAVRPGLVQLVTGGADGSTELHVFDLAGRCEYVIRAGCAEDHCNPTVPAPVNPNRHRKV